MNIAQQPNAALSLNKTESLLTNTDQPLLRRVRFLIPIEPNQDYRPITWPIKHPYWCSGQSDTYYVLVAYVENEEELMALWPDAYNLETMQIEPIEFSSRFPKPDWYNT